MSNLYQESAVAGTRYRRSNKIEIENKDLYKAITFYEEEVINLDDGTVRRNVDKLVEPFTTDNANTVFPLLNPETGEELSPGATGTYSGLYVMLYSLYMHLAKERDAQP